MADNLFNPTTAIKELLEYHISNIVVNHCGYKDDVSNNIFLVLLENPDLVSNLLVALERLNTESNQSND